MQYRVWLACALTIGTALSKEPLNTVPLNLVSPGNAATAPTDVSVPTDILGLRLPTSDASTQQPSNSSYIYDLSSVDNSTLTASYVPKCDGYHFGTNLDRLSCFDAFRNLPPTYERQHWGPRSPVMYDYRTLPHRWSSGNSLSNATINSLEASLTSP